MSVVWPSGATEATFYVPRHPIKSISNSVIEFDTQNVKSVLPIELQTKAEQIAEKINSHYLKSRQLEIRSFGERREDDFQQYNWGLALTLEMGLFSDQAELLMVLYSRDVDGRITEKEFSFIIAYHTSFRRLSKHKQKSAWKDLLTSWKINMKKAKHLPPTISKKAFIRILEVNFIDFDIDINQISKDFGRFDSEADQLQSLLLDDPILRGEIPKHKKQSQIISPHSADSLSMASYISPLAQERQRILKLQKSFSQYEDLDRSQLLESESARREGIDAAHDELSTIVRNIKKEREIRKFHESVQSQLNMSAELLESTKNLPALARSLSTLHIPVSLPNTARKCGFTPRSIVTSSRQCIEKSYSYSPPQTTRKHGLNKTQSLPDTFDQNLEESKVSPNITDVLPAALAAQEGGADGISAINTVRSISHVNVNTYNALPSLQGKSAIGGLKDKRSKIISSIESVASVNVYECNDGEKDSHVPIFSDAPLVHISPRSIEPQIIPNLQKLKTEMTQQNFEIETAPNLQQSHVMDETISVGGREVNMSAFSITEEAAQPTSFPNLTDLFELPSVDLLINVPKTGKVLRILLRHDDEGDASGLFVHGFLPYSRAEEQGLIKVGDEIILVDNVNVEGKELDDVVAALQNHQDEYVPIVVRRRDYLHFPSTPWRSPRLAIELSPRPYTTEEGAQPDDFPEFSELLNLPSQKYLYVVPKTNGQLRVMIRHDDDGYHKGLFVHGFRPYSEAEAQGLLKIGDEIIEIDGVNIAGGQIEELIDVLKANHTDSVSILICRREISASWSSHSPRFLSNNSEFLVEPKEISLLSVSQPSNNFPMISQTEQRVLVPRTNGLLRVIIKCNQGSFYVHGFKGNCRAEEVLRPGDTILEIDGNPVQGLNLKEVASLITNCVHTEVPMLLSRNCSSPSTS